ncbi:MAG: AMP-binding protein [Hyphomonadaceae bacterium]|nr:AMP-binding protein [Hyphomonadaceae bacterium]
MSVNLGDVLDRVAATVAPDDPAILCDGEVTGWGAFDRRSNALARALREAGLAEGAKVALYMRNCPEYVEALAASFKGRLAHVNVNYRYGGDELLYIFENSDAECVIFGVEFADKVQALMPRARGVTQWVQVGGGAIAGARAYDELVAGDGAPLSITRDPEDIFLLYTGGTTGLPKGVMWPSSAFWGANAAGRAPAFGMEPPADLDALMAQIKAGVGRHPVFVAPPLMHGTGLFSAVTTLTRGGAVMITRAPSFDPEAVIAAVDRHRAGGIIIVGDAFARPLLDVLRARRGVYDVTCVISMLSSGMMWSPDVKSGLLEFMPNAILADSFGASEGTGLGTAIVTRDLPPSEARFEVVATKVVRDDLTEVTPGSGEVGRVAKFGNLPLGYYKDPERTAKVYVMIGGERHIISGDHATVEADGTIRLLGRGSHCINSAGEKIYPEEVEEALKTHPAVHDALVFGMPDPRFGQTVAAVASLVDGAQAGEAELIAHVRDRLAPYKAPKKVVLAPVTPRAPNGKADYAAAKAIFADRA